MASESLYHIPPGCICMGDGLMGAKCMANEHATLKTAANKRAEGWYWVRYSGAMEDEIAYWRNLTLGGSWIRIWTPARSRSYLETEFSEIGPRVTREDSPPFHLHASDVQDALDAMIAAKRALEAAYARPVLIVDLMRVIERLEAYQT